jgi:ribonuclease P protein component
VKRSFRLTKSRDFLRVRRDGKSYAHPLIVLIASPNQREGTRVGIIAGKTVGKAVQRNRSKRMIRAVIQDLLPKVAPGWDIILIARKPMADGTYQQTETALEELLLRAKLI